jgi:hypothetical protein
MKKKLSIIFLLTSIFCVEIFAMIGAGTEADPFQIWTKNDLLEIEKHIGNVGGINLTENMHYILMNDIDSVDFVIGSLQNIGNTAVSDALINSQNPIETQVITDSSRSFKGILNGNNKSITVNYFGNSPHLALFYHNSGELKNIVIEGFVTNTNENGTAAGLVTINDGIITHCINNADISGRSAGGIAVINRNLISNCINNGQVCGL